MKTTPTLLLSLLLAALSGCASAGPNTRSRPVGAALHRTPTPFERGYAYAPPPAPASVPREMMPPRPAREAVWIGGQWAYTGYPGNPYEWVSGHWEIPPPGGRTWVPGGWQPRGNDVVFVRGHWQ